MFCAGPKIDFWKVTGTRHVTVSFLLQAEMIHKLEARAGIEPTRVLQTP